MHRILIVGGGPGGYIAALRAAQLGAQVVLAEKDSLGGTCLNRGCIPTKTFLHTVELYNEVLRRGPDIGLEVAAATVNWPKLMRRKDEVVGRLVGGVEALLKAKGVSVIKGTAKLLGSREALVERADGGTEKIPAHDIILATGSVPAMPPVPGFDLPGVVTSDEALSFDAPPKSMLIVGGGVIGIELASVFSPLGTEITVVEMLPDILPNVDEEIVGMMREILATANINIQVGAIVNSVEKCGEGLRVKVGGPKPFEKVVEKVLVAVGRWPNLAGLGLEAIGVELEKGRIKINERMATSLPGLWAIGDCASPIMLAHVASREGEVAAENIMGHPAKMDYRRVPGAIYTSPEIGWVGLSEKQARQMGHDVGVGRFPMAFNGKSLVMGADGLFKIVIDRRHGEILGAHLMGPRATDLIAEAVLAMNMEATVDDLVAAIHAHPTVSEAVGEMALDSLSRALAKI